MEKGRYQGAELSGAAFVLLSAPMKAGEAPVPERLFIAESASEKEAHAINAIVERQFGEVVVSRAPLRVAANAERLEASVGNFLAYRVRAAGESVPAAKVTNYLYPWLSNVKQWTAGDVTYTSQTGKRTRYSKTNSLHGDFRIPVSDDR